MIVYAFLHSFWQLLFPLRASAQTVASLQPDALVQELQPAPIPHGTALLPYQNPLVQACITETKFHNNATAAKRLAEALAEHVAQHPKNVRVVLIPIPLSKKRQRQRGYNQVERIVQAVVLQQSHCHSEPLLSRVHNTVPQTSLDRTARLKNIDHAFSYTATHAPDENAVYYIVDDVSTTGATLTAAYQTLEAHLPHLSCLALAH